MGLRAPTWVGAATEGSTVRPIWKGAVSFGLVNVPVRLYSATENHDVQFRQVHREDGGRIKYQRVCSVDGEQVAYEDIAKGYETEDGRMVVLTDEDLKELPVRSSKEITVEKFVPREQIDPIYFDKTYYLQPDQSAMKAYVLLRDALVGEDRIAVATVSIRTRQTMAVLRVREDAIVLQTMLWPDEVRATDELSDLDEDVHASDKELAMAKVLIEQLAGDYDPSEYEDEYEAAVKELVETKLEGGEVRAPAESEEAGGEVVDLLAALAKSVEKAKAARGEAPVTDDAGESDDDADDADETPQKAAAKKTTATKAAAKTTAKKTTAKKATAKKTTAKKAAPKKAS